jgi:hypothetical protein
MNQFTCPLATMMTAQNKPSIPRQNVQEYPREED